MNVFTFSSPAKRTNNAFNAIQYVKLGKKRCVSSKCSYYIISSRAIIKAIMVNAAGLLDRARRQEHALWGVGMWNWKVNRQRVGCVDTTVHQIHVQRAAPSGSYKPGESDSMVMVGPTFLLHWLCNSVVCSNLLSQHSWFLSSWWSLCRKRKSMCN